VVSCKKSECDKNGQLTETTSKVVKEHLLILKGQGIRNLVVAVNKMEEVKWSEARFIAVKQAISQTASSLEFDLDAIEFIPISGLTGHNLVKPMKGSWH
jgi:translation elongation factor EF-1alpha